MENQQWFYELLSSREVLTFLGFMAIVLACSKHDDRRH
jgi:hypothetical protein